MFSYLCNVGFALQQRLDAFLHALVHEVLWLKSDGQPSSAVVQLKVGNNWAVLGYAGITLSNFTDLEL